MPWTSLHALRNSVSRNGGQALELPSLGVPKWYEYSYQRINDIDGLAAIPTNLKRRRRKLLVLGIVLMVVVGTWIAWISRPRLPGRRGPEGKLREMVENHLENEWNSTDWDANLPVFKHFEEQQYPYSSGEYQSEDWRVYNPYPDYESSEYKNTHAGDFFPCLGPRGKRLNESTQDQLHAFYGRPKDFPSPTLGSADVTSLDQDMCFDRIGLIGPYGLSAGWDNDVGVRREGVSSVNWDKVNWARLQTQCVEENASRFNSSARLTPAAPNYSKQVEGLEKSNIQKRTAILIRGHEGMKWDDELKRMMRAVIMQLSLGTGGEYECFFLFNVHTPQEVPFDQLSDKQHQKLIKQMVPPEFRKMTILWNEQQWEAEYPKLPAEYRLVHYAQWLPLQWFAKKRPDFDFYFNWELDVRYIGHLYDFVTKSSEWAKQQPRKGLWERNSRYYVPDYHNSYTNFSTSVESRYVDKPASEDKDGLIWGPYKADGQDYSQPWDPAVPEFNDQWGIGEDADVITFNPMFDPVITRYASKWHWWGYEDTAEKTGEPHKRATIITLMRVSHRLLSTMDYENTELGHHMGSEMWPQTTALHHGLKAVFVPHPLYMTSKWPGEAADFIFNNGDSEMALEMHHDIPRTGAGSGGRDSIFSIDREFSFFETTMFYYRAVLSMDFWRRIDGQRADGMGGPEWESKHGTYCSPPMLLHPIKAFDERDPRP